MKRTGDREVAFAGMLLLMFGGGIVAICVAGLWDAWLRRR